MFATLIYFNVQKNSKQPHFAKIWQILAKHDNISAAKWTKLSASDPNTKVVSFENLIMQNENFSVPREYRMDMLLSHYNCVLTPY